jgi:hypothetical protein
MVATTASARMPIAILAAKCVPGPALLALTPVIIAGHSSRMTVAVLVMQGGRTQR